MANSDLLDTGDYLEVTESERLNQDVWDDEDVNPDELQTMDDVPDGDDVELSTASLDEGDDE